MKRVILFFTMIAFLSAPSSSYPSGDPLKDGMILYQKHQYEKAAHLLCSSLPSIKPDQEGNAYLSIGMVYLKNAELYRELYHASVSVHLDYLKKLSSVQGEARSRFVKLYMGEALLETGNPKRAEICFKEFIKERIDSQYKALAKVGLGVSYYLQGKKQAANNLWLSLKKTDPEAWSELAAAYSKMGLRDRNPLAMCEKARAMAKSSGKEMSMRTVKNIIGIYARAGLIEKGLDLLRHADTKIFSYEELLVKNKVIHFYDLSLLNNLSLLFGKTSLVYLKKAVVDGKARCLAQYYLGEAYALLGSIDQSVEITDLLISSGQIPEKYKNMAKVRQAANCYRKGQKTEAMSQWKRLLQKYNAPYLLAEILLACSRLRVECPQIVAKATTLVEIGEGKRLSILNFAIGKYYLGKNDYGRAVSYMEAGRDKSNKNRIEYNDPLMLVNLAEAYYHTRQFSEALEIYFEMSKHFPAIRQIQVAMQGVYSMEQKSAGDVKIL